MIEIKKYQEGGAMPAEQVPVEQAPQQDPLMELLQVAAQALQAQDCQAAMAVCNGLLMLAQSAQGGQAPVGEPQGEPVFRKGGKIVKRINK